MPQQGNGGGVVLHIRGAVRWTVLHGGLRGIPMLGPVSFAAGHSLLFSCFAAVSAYLVLRGWRLG